MSKQLLVIAIICVGAIVMASSIYFAEAGHIGLAGVKFFVGLMIGGTGLTIATR